MRYGRLRLALGAGVIVAAFVAAPVAAQSPAAAGEGNTAEATIDRVKAAVVAVGTFRQTRQPQFSFRGTGFVVGSGRLVATNAHVLPGALDAGDDPETLVVLLPSRRAAEQIVRHAKTVATSERQDLALLQIDGPPLPALALGESEAVRDGQSFLFTGFPIGGALGLIPVTHRAMIGAVTPIVLPMATASRLDPRAIRQMQGGAFEIFQLDAVAHPGNSGSPLYDGQTGSVIGIVNMTIARATKESALPQPTGIAYAIPVSHLKSLLATVR